MSTPQRPLSSSEPVESLYFAYGSNLSFGQMAKRCPRSRFVGRARLHQFKFQINERGFANVVNVKDDNPDAFVEGLCYLLTRDDEARLDRSEGVPTAYTKKMLEVEFFPASVTVLGRTVTEIIRRPISPYFPSQLEQGRGETVKVLVYLSTKYVQPDRPWDEYIGRMEAGLQEALRQGISPTYIENDVRPLLKVGKGVRDTKRLSIFPGSD